MKTLPSSFARSRRIAGLTLLEILAVLAVCSVLSCLATPAFQSISASRGISNGVYEAASLLELARNEAVTRQTYVWVAFQNGDQNGDKELRMVAASSKDGSANSSLANLNFFTKPARIRNVIMTDWSSLNNRTQQMEPSLSSSSLSQNKSNVTIAVGDLNFADTTLTFTPNGQVVLEGTPTLDTPYATVVDLSLKQTRGATVMTEAESGAVLIQGSTGTVKLIRVK